MVKLLVLLISAVVLADSYADQKYANRLGLDERTMYGWKVRTFSIWGDKDCYGIFIGPRVFLTQSECVQDVNIKQTRIIITNGVYRSKLVKNQILVNKDKIFTGVDQNTGNPVFDRKVALIILDEPVIPLNETTASSFIKLAEDINDVDLSKCFVPEVLTVPIIANRPCQMKDANLTDNTIKEFTCTQDRNQFSKEWRESIIVSSGNGLFCRLKKNSDVIVLTGYVGTNLIPDFGYFSDINTVINLSGLNIDIMNF